MPKPEKNAMALVDVCRSPIRREIMILASELAASGETVTAKEVGIRLGRPLTNVSYHVAKLAEAGAFSVDGGVQKRGAWQRHYLPSEAFRATMTDTVALDRIAELIDGKTLVDATGEKIANVIRATGRPVEA
jgi:hypothetical protein